MELRFSTTSFGCMTSLPQSDAFRPSHREFACPRCGEHSSHASLATLGMRSYVRCVACRACYLTLNEWLYFVVWVLTSVLPSAIIYLFVLLPLSVVGALTPLLVLGACSVPCLLLALVLRPLLSRLLLRYRYIGSSAA